MCVRRKSFCLKILLTIILHVQRLGRIILADPSIMIQKPKIIIFFHLFFFARGQKRKDPQVSRDDHVVNAGVKKIILMR